MRPERMFSRVSGMTSSGVGGGRSSCMRSDYSGTAAAGDRPAGNGSMPDRNPVIPFRASTDTTSSDRTRPRLNSSHYSEPRMPSPAGKNNKQYHTTHTHNHTK